MPTTLEWLIPERILLSRNHGIVTTEEMMTLFTQVGEALATTIHEGAMPQLCHYITDTSQVVRHQYDLGKLRGVFKIDKSAMTNTNMALGWMIGVTPSGLARFFGGMLYQFMGLRHRQLATMEEALDFLADNDTSLNMTPEQLLQHYRDYCAANPLPAKV